MSDNHKMVRVEDVTIEPEEIEQAKEIMHPIVKALISGVNLDIEVLKEAMALQERHEDRELERQRREAELEYKRAMVAVKAALPKYIEQDKTVNYTPQGKDRVLYTHASAAQVAEVIIPILTEHGFTYSFDPDNSSGQVEVTCEITHSMGHSKTMRLRCPPDTFGGKSPSQAVASTITRLSRYLILASLGMATKDMLELDPRASDGSTIDADKNLKAVAWMYKYGVSVEQAVDHVGKGVEEWNGNDLEAVKELVKKKWRRGPEPVEPEEQSPIMRGMFEAARAVFDDKATLKIDELCKKNCFNFNTLTDEQCASITTEINRLADAG